MQELRLVAVSEDGTYAVLAVPGRGGRFSLPIDDRLRTVARGQFSRLAQYEIEVENPLRPKEIQDRIRAGETADEIADAAGIPIERIRRFEGPMLAEREYRAQEAQRSTVRGHTESGPGPRLGEIVLERLADAGAPADALAWDSRKRTDGNWQVQLQFTVDGRPQIAEWVFDPRRRQVIPADDVARRLCLPQVDWPAGKLGGLTAATATVTPIGSRLGGHHGDPRAEPDRAVARGAHAAPAGLPAAQNARQLPETSWQREARRDREAAQEREAAPARDADWAREAAQASEPARAGEAVRAPEPAQAGEAGRDAAARDGAPGADASPAAAASSGAQHSAAQPPTAQPGTAPPGTAQPAAAAAGSAAEAATVPGRAGEGQAAADGGDPAVSPPEGPGRPGRKAAGARGRRASVPSWDEIMLGNSRQPD